MPQWFSNLLVPDGNRTSQRLEPALDTSSVSPI